MSAKRTTSKHTKPKPTRPGLDMATLQANLESSHRAWIASEKALGRAQESRDSALGAFQVAEQAFRDGARTVLG